MTGDSPLICYLIEHKVFFNVYYRVFLSLGLPSTQTNQSEKWYAVATAGSVL